MTLRSHQIFLGVLSAFGLSAVISASCTVEYPDRAFRCDPKQGGDACPEGFICCSDDPTAMGSGNALTLPAYLGKNVSNGGEPVFSGLNNELSRQGLCIDVAAGSGDPVLMETGVTGCAVPCNPKWSGAEVDAVCGQNTICCQTEELGEKDCVLDGNTGCYRPAAGTDIGTNDNWGSSAHDTHQDPGGKGCEQFAAGDNSKKTACYDLLNVADSRGVCLTVIPNVVEACPLAKGSYIDACEQRNIAEGKTGC